MAGEEVVSSVVGRLGWRTEDRPLDQFKQKLLNASRTIDDFGRKLDVAIGKAANFAAKLSVSLGKGVAVGATAGATALAGFTAATYAAAVEWSARADEIAKTAKKLNVPIEQLQRLRFAAERSGVSADTLNGAFKDLQNKLNEGRANKDSPVAKLAKELGLSLDELTRRSPEERIGMIADALNGIVDPATRAAVQMQFFGEEAGVQLGSLLAEGSAGIKSLGDEAQRTGKVMSASAAADAEVLQDKLTNLNARIEGAKTSLLSGLVPAFADATEKASDFIDANQDLIKQDLPDAIREITSVMGDLTAIVAKATAGWGQLIKAAREFNASEVFEDNKWVKLASGDIAGFREGLESDARLSALETREKYGNITADEREELRRRRVGFDPKNNTLLVAQNLDAEGRAAIAAAAAQSEAERAAEAEELRKRGAGRVGEFFAKSLADAPAAFARQKAREKQNKKLLAALGGGGGGAGAAAGGEKVSKAAMAQVESSGLGEEVRTLGLAAGASEKAIQAALNAAAKQIDSGASSGVARDSALSTIKSMTGVDRPVSEAEFMADLLGISMKGASTAGGGGTSAVSGAKFVRVDASSEINIDVTVDAGGVTDPETVGALVAEKIGERFQSEWRQIEDHFAEILES